MEQLPNNPQPPVVQPDSQPKPRNYKQVLLVGVIVLVSFGLLNMAIWGIYAGRAYPGVKIAGQDVSNLDRGAIASRVANGIDGYIINIDVKAVRHQVTAESLGLQYKIEDSATSAVAQGKNQWLPLYGLVYTWQNGAVDLSYHLDSEKFNQVVTSLAGTASVAPIDAKVIIDGETVRVEPDKPGRGIDSKQLTSQLLKDIAGGVRQDSVGERPTRALVGAKQAEAIVPVIQQAMRRPISIQINGRIFAPTVIDVGKWLNTTSDSNGKLSLGVNQDGLAAYVAQIAGQLDVAAVNKQINMVNGEVRTVSDGKNGSALDRTALAASLTKAITTGQTTAIVGSMVTVAYKTRTNNSVDLNGKYVEINLSRQHMWVYNEKQLVYDAPITSGATGAGFATVQGLFSIKAKQTNRNLNGYAIGYNYNVFVQYWMPFYGNYGLHDASWRSSFGGSDYYYGGSHGCVNLPTDAAAWLYNYVVVGTPVWVHS